MERSESEEIKRIDEITKEISPTFCFAKWYHANIYFQTGETHSCYHPAPHKIDTAPLLTNPSAITQYCTKESRTCRNDEGRTAQWLQLLLED